MNVLVSVHTSAALHLCKFIHFAYLYETSTNDDLVIKTPSHLAGFSTTLTQAWIKTWIQFCFHQRHHLQTTLIKGSMLSTFTLITLPLERSTSLGLKKSCTFFVRFHTWFQRCLLKSHARMTKCTLLSGHSIIQRRKNDRLQFKKLRAPVSNHTLPVGSFSIAQCLTQITVAHWFSPNTKSGCRYLPPKGYIPPSWWLRAKDDCWNINKTFPYLPLTRLLPSNPNTIDCSIQPTLVWTPSISVSKFPRRIVESLIQETFHQNVIPITSLEPQDQDATHYLTQVLPLQSWLKNTPIRPGSWLLKPTKND